MDHVVYWLGLWIGIMCAAFALMATRWVVIYLRARRKPEKAHEKSVIPILRFNLRKHFVEEIKAGAGCSLERMQPGEMTYRLREVLLNHDATMRVASEVLGHIDARSDSKNGRRGRGMDSRRRMRI